MKTLILMALVISATSCASMRTGNVDANMILPKAAEKIKVPEDQEFLFPAPVIEQILPDYPAELIASGGSANVCIEIVVDENGEVAEASPLFNISGCPDSPSKLNPLFIVASITAVKQWQFSAAAICKFPATVKKNDGCDGDGVVITTIPIKLAYTFDFNVKNKKPVVRSAKTKAIMNNVK